jgi:hypothetical protein
VIRDAPHHSIMGQTRSGKSHLTRWGILETCRFDRVLFIDCKGDDPTLAGLGRVVNRFPSRGMRSARQLMSDGAAYENWFRLVISTNWELAREQIGEALEAVMDEGDWVVVIDELRVITDTRPPGVNLAPQWEAIILRGGGKGVGAVNLTQEPRWVRGSFYSQPSFLWISRVEDEAAQKRIAEIGSSRALLEHLSTIKRRWWIYTDSLEDERFWALTQAPPAAAGAVQRTVEPKAGSAWSWWRR